MTDPREVSQAKQAAIDAVFDDLPDNYPDLEYQLKALHRAFRDRIAKALQPKLNDLLKNESPATLDAYRALALRADRITSGLGVCVCIDGKPALLAAELAQPWDQNSPRFVTLQDSGSHGISHRKPLVTVPSLVLMPAPDDIDSILKPLREHARSHSGRSR